MQVPGLVNVDFADVRAIMANAGSSLMGIGTATGTLSSAIFPFLSTCLLFLFVSFIFLLDPWCIAVSVGSGGFSYLSLNLVPSEVWRYARISNMLDLFIF